MSEHQDENENAFCQDPLNLESPLSNVESRKRKSPSPEYVEIDTTNLKSPVWKEMIKIKKHGKFFAICNHCKKWLSASHKGGTRHLIDHLNICRQRKNMDVKQQLLQANLRRNEGQVEYRNFVFDQMKSREELASMIIVHEYPLSIVDHTGFRRFVNSLQPMFRMVTRNTIRKDILKIYDNEKARQSNMFEELQSRVAITSDMWSSKSSKRGFMVVTAHFLDDEWVMQSRILRFIYVPAPHDHSTLTKVLIDCLDEWNLEGRVSTITLDNCSTNDKMIDELKKKLDSNSLLVEGEVLHMRCCAHILNIIVQFGLDVIKPAIEKVRDSVVFWTASAARIEKFEDYARKEKTKCTKKLCLDCKTRWNSTYLMLETAISYRDVFTRLKREPLYTCAPEKEEWELAKIICEKFKLFHETTECFSGTKYPTANAYFPKICEIKLQLCEWIESPLEVVKEMAGKMMKKYTKYWDDLHIVMGVAAVLDPQFKMVLVHYYFNQIYGVDASYEISKIRRCCYDLIMEYQEKMGLVQGNDLEAMSSYGDANNDNDPLAKFDRFVQAQDSISGDNFQSKATELDLYLEEKVLPRTPNFDVLGWWKTNGIKFPTLRMIARDILAIPVSTVASESAFSTSGRVLGPHRSRLHPTTLEALICSQNWLCNDKNGPYSLINPKIFDEETDDNEA